MKVFLSSTTGFLNGSLLEHLIKSGHTVVSLDDPTDTAATDKGFTAVSPETDEEWLTVLLDCDAIIYDLHTSIDCIYRTINALTRASNERWSKSGTKIVLALSSLLTWGRVSSPCLQQYESEWEKRVPISSHVEIRAAEDLILFANSSRLRTTVIGCGILYGSGEDILGHWFKAAWMDPSANIEMPVWDDLDGQNRLPMIHVQDLCGVVLATLNQEANAAVDAISDNGTSVTSQFGSYVVAVDAAQSSLREVFQAISTEAASGNVSTISRPQLEAIAFISDQRASPIVSSSFQVDLSFEASSQLSISGAHQPLQATVLMQNAGTKWQCCDGFVANVGQIAAEYRAFHHLLPLRIAILGSPGSGKTTLAKALSDKLSIPFYDKRSVIIAAASADHSSKPKLTKELKKILTSTGRRKEGLDLKASFEGRINASLARQLVTASMEDKIAPRVHGWILDGAVSSCKDARDFFFRPSSSTAAALQKNKPVPLLKPDLIFVLDGADEKLTANNVLMASDAVLAGYNDEAGLKKRLNAFRDHSIYFEPEVLSDSEGDALDDKKGAAKAKAGKKSELDDPMVRGDDHFGGPFFTETLGSEENPMHNLDMSNLTLEDVQAQVLEEIIPVYMAKRPIGFRHMLESAGVRSLSLHSAAGGAGLAAADGVDDTEDSPADAVELASAKRASIDDVAVKEKAMLKERCKPLTRYLMAQVIPALTNGTLAMCKAQPHDPLEFLAGWLEEHNPEKRAR